MRLDPKKIPRHIAIIMDGNGRWARERNLPRIAGHHQGSEKVDEIVMTCRDLGVPYLTLYSFSMENWARPRDEVEQLMLLLREFLIAKRKKLISYDIRLETIGDIDRLPSSVQEVLQETKTLTAHCSSMVLVLALSYGSRNEILRAVQQILKDKAAGRLHDDDLTERQFQGYLDTEDMPDPDLLIRTGGDRRISNFMLWQSAYTELIFTETRWPDFHKEILYDMIAEYQGRERRFGQTSDQVEQVIG